MVCMSWQLIFCIKKLNRGERAYERRSFGYFIKLVYKIGCFLKTINFRLILTKNTMMAALKVGEMDWAATFLDEYKTVFAATRPRNDFQIQ